MSSPHRPALRRAACLLLIAALAACSDKSENEQLLELRDSLAYTQYRQLSDHGLPGAIGAYRKGMEWSGKQPPVEFGEADYCAMHVLLAYGALVADKSTIALAESDIVEARGCGAFDRVAANSLRSVVFQRLEWPQLAQAESDKVWAAPQSPGAEQPPVAHVITLHAALTYLAVSEKRWDRAQVHIDALGQLLKQPWMSDLPRAGLAFQEGRTRDGLVALKRMSRDPSAPEPVRQELARFIAKVEAKGGDVDSFAFMPRLIAVLTWEAVKDQGPEVLSTTTRFAEEQAWKPLNDTVKQGAGKARDVAGGLWDKARGAVAPDAKAAPEAAPETAPKAAPKTAPK